MQKITAILVIISLLAGNFSAVAQVPGKFLSPRNFKGTIKGLKYAPNTISSSALRSAELLTRVERTARNAALDHTLKSRTLVETLTPHLILSHPIAQERGDLLRRVFPTVGKNASVEERSQAAAFWREDLSRQTAQMTKNASAASDALADAASLGLFGQKEDISLLEDFYQAAKALPQAPQAAAVFARTLLAHGEYSRLEEFFAAENGCYAGLQNGIAQYIQANQINAKVSSVPLPENYKGQPFHTQIILDGLSVALTGDPSAEATAIWVNLTHFRPAAPPAEPTTFKGPQNPLELPDGVLQDPQALQLSAREITLPSAENTGNQAGENAVPAENHILPKTAEAAAVAPEMTVPVSAPPQRKKLIDFFIKKDPKPQAAQAKSSAAVSVSAPRISLKTAWGKIKNIFSKNPPSSQNAAPDGKGISPKAAALQRAGIYMASYVMGLEVATPVIANFGSSFGLSLEENILVAVATYFPYSVGAIFSNWTKKVLGRKNSMNLGLALMGGGLMAGVLLCGLNGAFVPEANTLMHFYKALACITVASMGGVLVHNSVGPIMTELSANASELVKQKRNSYTELSRALGMASSFAFPYLATKVMGMDWSLAFALPLPLIGLSALGVNLAKIPNTKTLISKVTTAAKTDIPHKKSLKELITNNEYIRLFKEEKGVGAFLSGLFIMNAVEMSLNNGFLFMLPSMTKDQSAQYLFGLAQFAAPFILGRYLAGKFLQWFPQHNMSVATLMAAGGAMASLFALNDVYALTAALFLAETGISTGFTLGFARTAKNPATQDRVVALLVASAISCAFGPLLLTNLAQSLIDAGIMDTSTATATAMLGIPSALALFSAGLFHRMENMGEVSASVLKKIYSFIKKSVFFPKQRRKRS